MNTASPHQPPATVVDAVVVGAGIAGMYQLHRLRELGLHVQGIEAGSDVGGTWYWNRYPGARLDSQGEVYQYWFSKELYEQWPVRERFSAQPDVEAWLHYVADKLDLRRHFRALWLGTARPPAGPVRDLVAIASRGGD